MSKTPTGTRFRAPTAQFLSKSANRSVPQAPSAARMYAIAAGRRSPTTPIRSACSARCSSVGDAGRCLLRSAPARNPGDPEWQPHAPPGDNRPIASLLLADLDQAGSRRRTPASCSANRSNSLMLDSSVVDRAPGHRRGHRHEGRENAGAAARVGWSLFGSSDAAVVACLNVYIAQKLARLDKHSDSCFGSAWLAKALRSHQIIFGPVALVRYAAAGIFAITPEDHRSSAWAAAVPITN